MKVYKIIDTLSISHRLIYKQQRHLLGPRGSSVNYSRHQLNHTDTVPNILHSSFFTLPLIGHCQLLRTSQSKLNLLSAGVTVICTGPHLATQDCTGLHGTHTGPQSSS